MVPKRFRPALLAAVLTTGLLLLGVTPAHAAITRPARHIHSATQSAARAAAQMRGSAPRGHHTLSYVDHVQVSFYSSGGNLPQGATAGWCEVRTYNVVTMDATGARTTDTKVQYQPSRGVCMAMISTCNAIPAGASLGGSGGTVAGDVNTPSGDEQSGTV